MTEKKKMRRREFLKATGLAGLTLPAVKIVSRANNTEFLSSQEQYGSFLVKRNSKGDPVYKVDTSRYKRFLEKNTMFSRSHWDQKTMDMETQYRGTELQRIKNKDPGYSLLDYSFYHASWTGDNNIFYKWTSSRSRPGKALYDLPAWKPDDLSPREVTDIIKKAALFYGASMVGVAKLDERWVYSKAFYRRQERQDQQGPVEADIFFKDADEPVKLSENNQVIIPKSCKYVIAMVLEMDIDASEAAPTCIAAAATGNGYTRMAVTAGTLAQFIRGLGYMALPQGNDTSLSIPIAVDAGLGELGRHGLLITPKFGSRVRICKVFTDMPLIPDGPISFGVTEFCEICGKCAKHCPSGSIMEGPRTYKRRIFSNNPGVYKWPIDPFKCYQYWQENGTDCNTCIYVCPYNKPESWLHDAARTLIGFKSRSLNKIILELDNASGYGEENNPLKYWKKNNFIHIK